MNFQLSAPKQNLSLKVGLFILIIIQTSCTIQQRRYSPGFHVENNSRKQESQTQLKSEPIASPVLSFHQASIDCPNAEVNEVNLRASLEFNPTSIVAELQQTKQIVTPKHPLSRPDSLEPCQKLIMNNGNEISALILEIGTTDIRYKRCENRNGPDYVLPKSLIFLVQYPDGRNEIINPKPTSEEYNKKNRSVEPLGVIGTILGALGLIAFGIPLGLIAFILGALGLGKIKTNPEKFRGRGWAIASMIIGTLSILGGVLYIYLVL